MAATDLAVSAVEVAAGVGLVGASAMVMVVGEVTADWAAMAVWVA